MVSVSQGAPEVKVKVLTRKGQCLSFIQRPPAGDQVTGLIQALFQQV
jgi:hypothetical protein